MERLVDLENLVDAILKLRDAEEVKAFLHDILTKSEQETLALRLRVAEMLDNGIPYKQIERETGASSATIAKISEFLKYGYGGYRTVLERVRKSKKINS